MQSLVLVYQAIAVLVFVASLFLAYDWLKNPFIGGFFEQTMVLNDIDTTEAGRHWALYEQGFKLGEQLVSVDGQIISNAEDLDAVLGPHRVGQTVPVTIRTAEGPERSVDVTLQQFPASDRISYFILPAVLSIFFLVISMWIFGLRRNEPAGRAFSVMTSSLAIVIGSLFDLYTSHRFTYLWTMAAALSGGAMIDLALGFPQEARIAIGRPYLRWIGYIVGFILALTAYTKLYDFNNPTAYFTSWQLIYAFVGFSALFYFGALAFQAFRAYSPVVKNQARTILYGSLIAFGPIVFWLLYSSLRKIIFPPQTLLHSIRISLYQR